jgi:hypothetical protein
VLTIEPTEASYWTVNYLSKRVVGLSFASTKAKLPNDVVFTPDQHLLNEIHIMY